jgi:hypothetical protein
MYRRLGIIPEFAGVEWSPFWGSLRWDIMMKKKICQSEKVRLEGT